jgi:Fur family transcriptional regulator, ferric uptake regulator
MPEIEQADTERTATRDTRQRRAIRAAFLGTDRPLDPTEVLTLAATGHSSLGIATVYRNIKSLLEEGWLTPVELPGEVTHYELAGKEHHHHFHCRTCGKVYELNACLPNVQKLAPQGFQVAGHDLLLYGACRECSPA